MKPGGDVIVSVNGHKITRTEDLGDLIARFRPGEIVTLGVLRDADRRQIRVKLGARPTSLPG